MGYLFLLLLSSALIYMCSQGTAVMDNVCSPYIQIILGRMLILESEIVKLKKTVADLEWKNEALSGGLNNHRTGLQENQNEVMQIKEQNEQFNNTFTEMQTQIDKIRECKSDFDKTAKGLQQELAQTKEMSSDLNNTMQNLQIDLNHIEQSNTKLNSSVQIQTVQVNRRMSQMNTSMEDQIIKLAQIYELYSEFNTSVLSLQTDMVHVKERTSQMNMSIENQQTRLAEDMELNSEFNTTVQNVKIEMVQMMQRLLEMNMSIEDQKTNLAHIIKLNSEFNTSCQSLQTDMVHVNGSFHLLQSALAKLDEQNEALNGSLENIIFDIRTLAAKTDELDSTVQEYTEKELSTTNATTTVVFTARRIHNATLTGGEILVFDEVLINAHGAYNKSNGMFVAPLDGNYLLSVTSLAQYGTFTHLIIVKNDIIEIGRVFTGYGQYWSSGSVTIAVYLEKGDHVCVKHLLELFRVAAVHGDRWSSFMGVLLS